MLSLQGYLPLRVFGWLNVAWVVALAAGAVWAPQFRTDGMVFTLSLQAVVSAALLFTAHQLRAGTDLGHKALPAVLVAYSLWLLMALRG